MKIKEKLIEKKKTESVLVVIKGWGEGGMQSDC